MTTSHPIEPPHEQSEDYRALQELKDYFTVTLSGEFTTHLAKARAHVKFLEKALDAQKLQGFIAKAFADADESFAQMEERIRLLLDYADLFSRKDEPGKDLVLLQELLQKSAESLQLDLQKRKILLRITINPRLGPIKSDKEKLLQVFFHLLKFMADKAERGEVIEIVGTEEEAHLRFEFLSRVFPSFRPDYLGVMGLQRDPVDLKARKNLDITIVSHLVEDCAGTLEPLHRGDQQVGLVMRLPKNYRLPAEVLAEIRSKLKVMDALR
jgi:hypothetical protein